MDLFTSLAKKTVEAYVKTGKVIKPPIPLPQEFQKRAGVFVSIHKITPKIQPISSLIKERFNGVLHPQELHDGFQPPTYKEELRGCIGTYLPSRKNLAEEIIHNAIDAATRDPRFFPVSQGELPQLRYSVDILSPIEIVTNKKDLDVRKYGLIVASNDGRKGLLLPDLEGVETVEQQIEICHQKAGISPKEKITLQRFTVERHEEK